MAADRKFEFDLTTIVAELVKQLVRAGHCGAPIAHIGDKSALAP